MTQRSLPWTGTTTGDATQAPFSDDDWALVWYLLFGGDGVVYNDAEELEPSVSSGRVKVASGSALVKGRLYRNDAPIYLTPTVPAAATRVDRVVLRADWTARTVRAVLVENEDTGTGAAPDLVQEDGYQWEVSICSVTVTTGGTVTVEDLRDFVPRAERTLSRFIPCMGGRDSTTPVTLYGTNVEGAILMDAAVVTSGYGNIAIPRDYRSGGVIYAVVRSSTAGDMVYTNTAYYGAEGEDYNQHSQVASGTVALGDTQIDLVGAVTLTDARRGDLLTMRFDRTGTDGSDTAGDVHLWGWLLRYTSGN